ncbi:chromosome segregation DNA-binding protein [Gemmobacter aquaticus]|uniref:Chromosome segregation DNA-binding protein n=1 Tax=Gemmobacter aquaticus TaxID=490185 RepID=A0A917YK53_9RHOB|nr:ParB/RepB/Spo0J family partition protein [Gemmobacter aquaticus]GGO33387.1 chromosome segregation DNA-binding protein [Gemmobacter aquaticus]
MMERKPTRGLGRGLSALMADINIAPGQVEANGPPTRRTDMLPVDQIRPNPDQPRRNFVEEDLADLAESIKAKGILQPLIVRPSQGQSGYEIVAGERRWRAAQLAKVHEVPVLIRDLSDTEVLEIAIIENIQRADLNPIEEAQAFRQLMDRFGHTQEKLADALSKSRSYIANLLRLLNLPEEVRAHVISGKLSAGHARALITTPDPSKLAREVIDRGLSVRETENLVKRAGNPIAPPRPTGERPSAAKDADTIALERDLIANLGMQVSILHEPGGERGEVRIRYNTLDDLDFLCQALSLARRDGL